MTELNIDILNLIFNELKANKNALHSCLLVNREWCRLVVPVLWKNHAWDGDFWYIKNIKSSESEKMLYNTILSSLPTSSKQLLSDNSIKLPSTILSKPPLFNYISFCEFPEIGIIERIIKMVIWKRNENYKRNLVEQEICKFFVSQSNNCRQLKWKNLQPLSSFPGASTCFSQLYHLSINVSIVNSDALYKMAQICRDLNSLSICKYSQDLPGLISLIDAQRNLKSIRFFNLINKGTCKELVRALAIKSNTIRKLKLKTFSTILPSLLTSLTGLETMSINSDETYKVVIEKEIKEYLAIWEFPDLRYLTIIDLSCFKELAMLIEKTKGNILQVKIHLTYKNAENTGMLIKAITNNCPNIKVLRTYLEPDDFVHIKSLLINCRNLVEIHFLGFFLIFIVNENENESTGDELLDILTKYSPSSLVNISIDKGWDYSDDAFEQFFESCRERTLHYFNINDHKMNHEEILRKYYNEGVINQKIHNLDST